MIEQKNPSDISQPESISQDRAGRPFLHRSYREEAGVTTLYLEKEWTDFAQLFFVGILPSSA